MGLVVSRMLLLFVLVANRILIPARTRTVLTTERILSLVRVSGIAETGSRMISLLTLVYPVKRLTTAGDWETEDRLDKRQGSRNRTTQNARTLQFAVSGLTLDIFFRPKECNHG